LKTAILFTLCAAAGLAQTAKPARFDVAVVRPVTLKESNSKSACFKNPLELRCISVTLKRCIGMAYNVSLNRITGGPPWIDSEKYYIAARTTAEHDDDAMRAMWQTLLAERFKLTVHRENQVRPAMSLQLAPGGPKFKDGAGEEDGLKITRGQVHASNIKMAGFADALWKVMAFPVVDQTGLTGSYEMTLQWNQLNVDVLPSYDGIDLLRKEITEGAAEQLGLTLKAEKLPIDVIVVDQAVKAKSSSN
jgi:uncharacterized protein (TIGR03435 family)